MNSKMEQIRDSVFATSFLPGKEVRAVFYGRVSTDNETQKDSCENQLFMAETFLRKHPNITLVEKFVDDGISGKNAVSRKRFMAMIALIEEGEVDLIITKSMSRLHRDEQTAYYLRDLCEENDVTIFILENEQLLDFEDDDAMFIQSIQALMDAQYVQRQSKYGRMTHKTRCERKELSAKDICFGYNWDSTTKTISINEEEAEVVREILNSYVYEQKMPAEIAKNLISKGYSNRFSRVDFTAGTINKIVQNEKYIGKFYINKRTNKLGKGMNGKSKRIALPKEQWILVDRPDLAIVDEELFSLAVRLRESRQTTYFSGEKSEVRKRFEGKHDFSNKVRCACCGKYYRFDFSDRARTIPIYRIGSHKDCPNKNSRIQEAFLREAVETSIKRMLKEKEDSIHRVEDLLCKNIETLTSNEGEFTRINKEIARLNKEIDKLSDALLDKDIRANEKLKNSFITKLNNAQNEIEGLEIRKKELEVEVDTSSIKEKIAHLTEAIKEFVEVKELNRDRVLRNIKEITIDEEGNLKLVLSSGLSFVGKLELPLAQY